MTFVNIAHLRDVARQRLPRMFFDYLDGGSFSETTLRRNVWDFEALVLEQRILADVADRDLSHMILGRRAKLPVVLGPIGFCGMMAPRGELLAARAASAAGIPFCLSTFSVMGLEELARNLPEPPLFQLYVFRDRALAEAMLDRARRLKVDTIVVTVDAGVSGVRERDTRNGFRTASRLSARSLLDIALHPRWAFGMAHLGKPALGNVAEWPHFGTGLMEQASRLSATIDPSLDWSSLRWLRRAWHGRLVVKGVLSVHDATAAIDVGADAIVVSNHGGRQLDGATSSIAALPRIVAAVGGRTEVLLDSGVRRGADIVKALALGANGVLLGRAYMYGLAAAGQTGVAAVLDLLAAEMSITMALMGLRTIAELREAGPERVRREPILAAAEHTFV